MASKIEWTEATLPGRRPLRRVGRHVVQRKPIKSFFFDDAPRSLKPFPEVGIALRTVAGHAGRQHIVRLCPTAARDRYSMIPRCSWIIAVGAKATERLENEFLPLNRDRLYSTLTGLAVLSPLGAEPFVPCVPLARLTIQARPASPLTLDLGERQPVIASAAPCKSIGAHLLSLIERRTWRNSITAAEAADISPSIVSGSVNREIRQRAMFPALRALLFAIRPANNVAAVSRASVLRLMLCHTVKLAQIAAGRLLDGREWSEYPEVENRP